MDGYGLAEAAQRAGIGADELRRLVESGIVSPGDDGRFTSGTVRRVGKAAGLPATRPG